MAVDIKQIPQQILSFFQAMTGTNIDLLELYFGDNVGIDNTDDNEIIFGKGESIRWVLEHQCNVIFLGLEQITNEKYLASVEISNEKNEKSIFNYMFIFKKERIIEVKIGK